MEIERKFLVEKSKIPADLEQYPHNSLEQAYIITEPVLRIRRKNDTYILTYKGAGLMQREEVEFPLTKEAYDKLLTKTEGNVITKTRYKIPEANHLTIVRRVDSEIGGQDSSFDIAKGRFIPGLNLKSSGVGGRNSRHLIDGGGGAVIFNLNFIEDGSVCSSCANCFKISIESTQAFVHSLFHIADNCFH